MAVVGFGTKLAGVLGPAKWAAIALISGLAGAGLTYALITRGTEPVRIARPVEPIVTSVPGAALPAAEEDLTRFRPRARPMGPELPTPEPGPRAQAEPPPSAPVAEPEAVVPEAQRTPQAAPPPTQAATPKRLNLNTANQAELELLPGIGPKTAIAILEYRKANGRFRSVTDLDKIKGIGPKTLERMAPLVCVD